jgi:hypothetical protein
MAWQGFLAQALFPAATRLRARWDDPVEAVMAGVPASATHFLFHISVTMSAGFPERRAELLAAFAARGIKAVNERATDISKPFTQALCASLGLPVALATRDLPANTAVMLKTSLNHGGKIERYLPPPVLARLGMHLADPNIGPHNYAVMPAGDVPEAAWGDPALCIERYISNDDGRYHRAYVWRDRLVLWEGINPEPIKKTFGDVSSRTMRFVLVDGHYRPAPGSDVGPEALLDQLALFVPAIGLDFGTVDAMSDNEGRYYIVDVNSTPFFRSRAPDILDHLGGAQ